MTSTVLPSGLRVLLDEDPHATAVGIVSVIRGGSGTDPAGAEGLAHLVEHLTYRATDPPQQGQPAISRWDQLTKYASSDVNGYTSPDWMMFYEFGPPTSLAGLLQLEAARLITPLAGVDEVGFALERQVIGSEHRLREDPRAGGWAANTLFPTLFPPEHPYARSTGGTEESRRSLTLLAAKTYAAENFRPERTTLMVSTPPGLLSMNTLVGQLPAALRGDAQHPTTRSSNASPTTPPAGVAKSVAAKLERKPSPLPTAELWLGWSLPGAYGPSGRAEEILGRWLQEDLSAGSLSEEEPHIRHVNASIRPGLVASALFVRALISDGADPERVRQVIESRVTSLWAREPTQQDTFAQFRSLFETQHLLDLPGQQSRVLEEAMGAAMTERAQSMNDMMHEIEMIPSATVAQFAYQQLTHDRARAVLFSPGSTAETGRATPATRPPASAKGVPDLVPGAAAWNPRELSSVLPMPPEVVVKDLPTGLTTITVRKHAATVVAWLAFRGGYSNAEPPLLVELALRARPDAQQATKLHMLPGRGATRDLSFDVVEFLPSHLPDGLTLLFAKATAPIKTWPAKEAMDRMLAPIAAMEDRKSMLAESDFWHALLGDNPYAHILNTADLGKLTHSDVEAWLGHVRNVHNGALVVVGDVDPDEVDRAATILSRQLNSPTWVADLPTPPAPVLRPSNSEHMVPVITSRPGSLTEVRLGCLLSPLDESSRGHYELLKYAMESRLNSALRIEHGDGYGVSVDYNRLRGGTTYLDRFHVEVIE